MKKRGFPLVALLLTSGGLLTAESRAQAQTLRIHVVDAQTGAGINGASVTAQGDVTLPRVTTDSLGRAFVQLSKPGPYSLTVVALAYRQQRIELTVDSVDSQDVQVKLVADPIRLPSVASEKNLRSAQLEQAGFYERMRHDRGYFLDPDEIEKRNQRKLSDLLRNAPGIRMKPVAGGMAVWFQGNETMNPSSAGGLGLCGPRVILNGIELNRPDTRDPTPIDDIVATADLLAIEIYRRPSQLPARFGGAMSACGVIVLWTK